LACSVRAGALALAALALAACASVPSADVLARLDAHLGELLLVGFRGTALPDNVELDALLCGARTGGILLFARNIIDATQVAALTAASVARAAECGTSPLLVAVDAEGGRVMRLSPAAGYAATLSHKHLGDGNDLALTELEARRIGAMLRAAGINWNLAPVVDVGYNPANPVIVGSGRSFSANPVRVAAQARAFIAGLRREGVLSALKHFPGHGSSFADSHLGFVDVTDTADASVELAPYRLLLGQHMVDSVMTAHVFNRRLDPHHPATLSRRTITGVLRGQLGWSGVVVSDDLRMGAIEQHYGMEEAAVLALGAGVDVLLIAEDRLSDGRSAAAVALEAIRSGLRDGRLSVRTVEAALARVDTFKRALRSPP
jgi:beta-N-acetylhexosaminidase